MKSIPPEIEIIKWQDPWYAHSSNEIDKTLKSNLPAGHVLFGEEVRSVARRKDNDDVLFYLPGNDVQFAIVHLTYSKETDPKFPHTVLLSTIEELRAKIVADIEEFSAG